MADSSDEVKSSEPEPSAPRGRAASISLIGGKLKNTLTSSTLAKSLLGQFAAGLVLIIATTSRYTDAVEHFGYTIAVGSVGCFFALVGLFLLASSRGETTRCTVPVLGPLGDRAILSLFLLGWWGIGVSNITFQSPFTETGNGYFAAWLGFACTLWGIGAALPRLKASTSGASGSLLGLAVCAIVVGWELATGTTPGGFFKQIIFGLIVATITFTVVCVFLLLELNSAPVDAAVRRALLITIVLLWGSAATWLTFTGPFQNTAISGNGYFGLWFGLIAASMLVMDAGAVSTGVAAALANETLAALWGQLVAGCVLILAVMGLPDVVEFWGYALSVGIVGAVIALLGAATLQNPTGAKPLIPTKKGPITLNRLLACFLFFWWGVGAGILTIRSPFTVTGNGYFAVWAGFACSVFGLGVSLASTKAAASSGLEGGLATHACLATCSIMIILVVAPNAADNDAFYQRYTGQIVYAFIVGGITLVRVLISVYLHTHKKTFGVLVEKILTVTRLLKWVVLASWCTFDGPFATTGNGYFASWMGVLCSVLLLLSTWFPELMARPERAEGPSDSLGDEEIGRESVTANIVSEEQANAPSEHAD